VAHEARGQTGSYVSDLLPNTAEIVDEVTFVRGMQTDEINHVPAQPFSNRARRGWAARAWGPG